MNRLFVVSLRDDESEDAVAQYYVTSSPKERVKVVLLIHGFNRSRSEAMMDLERFATACKNLAPTLEGNIGLVTWPGDTRFSPNRYTVFPKKIPMAVEAGKLLAKYLHDLVFYDREHAIDKLTDVVIVAHSLGCRVALEALDQLARDEGKGRHIITILMAAAVPVRYVDIGPFEKARECFPNMIVLHSKDDQVLRVSFPLGSLIGEPFYDIPEAIGLNGHPRKAFYRDKRMFGYGHSEYWEDVVQIPEEVAKAIGYPRGTTIPDRVIDGSKRSIPEREMPERRINERSWDNRKF